MKKKWDESNLEVTTKAEEQLISERFQVAEETLGKLFTGSKQKEKARKLSISLPEAIVLYLEQISWRNITFMYPYKAVREHTDSHVPSFMTF